MKRIIALLLTVPMLLTTVFAASAEVSAVVDYENSVIDITYKSNLAYNTDVLVYMLKSNQAFEDAASSIRTVQGYVEANSDASVQMKLGDDVAEGYYKFYAIAGGHASDESGATSEAVYILSNQKQSEILSSINNSDKTNIANVVYSGISSVFNFKESQAPSWKGEYLVKMRQDDFGGSFKSLNQVNNSWLMADILLKINSADGTDLQTVLSQNKDVLGINTDDEDYIKYAEEVIRVLDYLLGQNKALSKTAAKSAFTEAVAVACVNKNSIENLDGVFRKYAKVLGVSDSIDEYATYNSLNFARQFSGFSANSADEVKIKFINTLNSFEDDKSNNSAGGGSGSGSSGGGFGSGTSVVIEPSSGTASSTAKKGFSDVADGYWASEPINALSEMGIINGYDDNTFKGENEVAREEFAKMIITAFGLEADENTGIDFADIAPSHWSYKYIKAASALGIVNGISETNFGAGNAITRADMAVMLNRAMTNGEFELSGSESTVFNDEADIPEYAKASVHKLAAAGIINGFADGSFKPGESLTRAQAAKVIYMVLMGK